uniref:Uncharacterized protein n=1 Tax=Anguilla anguilla TaxID=7936 RepID=A0A0E9XFL9_ANGAN
MLHIYIRLNYILDQKRLDHKFIKSKGGYVELL